MNCFKLMLAIAVLSASQISTAELNENTTAVKAVNKAAYGNHTDNQRWTQDQLKQAELEKKYKATILANPENKKTYAYLAGLYLSNNMSSKAIEAYQEAIIHDPTNSKLFAALSIAYLHKAKYGMAKAMADEALRLDPKLTGVKKINEYVTAKQKAIKAASKVPADGLKSNTPQTTVPHGGVMPTAMGDKPADSMHKLN